MRKISIIIFFILFVIWVTSSVAYSQVTKGISPQAKAYLQEFLDVIEKNSLRKKEVDWETLRRQTFEKADGAQEPIDTYEAIRFALRGLGDNHSFLQLSKELTQNENARRKVQRDETVGKNVKTRSPFSMREQPEGFLHKVGNCTVPRLIVPFTPFNKIEVMNVYAEVLYKFIIQADRKKPCGWIIDLRGNDGGAIFPMLAGVAPLLEEGDIVSALDANGAKAATFFYKDGQSGVREKGKETILTKIEGRLYQMKKQSPVAVLIDRSTASAGELMAIAFRSRVNTRFFGEHTYGASTTTQGFKLSDGANVVLATGVDEDRNGKSYPEGIEPDEIVPVGNKAVLSTEDPVIHAALGWLGEQAKVSKSVVFTKK